MPVAEKNRIPDPVKQIHFIAVCGTGMGALAAMLKEMGYHVSGSDQKVYPPMSDFLRHKGIVCHEGFSPSHIPSGTDLVVVGNAVSKDNPEVCAMDERELCFCSMPQAVNHFAAGDKQQILVTGTHGKTTTSSIIAWIFHQCGLDPSFMIGGIVNGFNSSYRAGNGDHIIIEADEYDTACFDKGPKFLHYRSHIAILTSVEFDHADIFRDLDHVKEAFGRFVHKMDHQATLIAFDSDENINSIIDTWAGRKIRYGKNNGSDWRLGVSAYDDPFTVFEVIKDGRLFNRFKTKMIGRHNLMNLTAAIAAADQTGIDKDDIARAIKTFEGTKRRQEVRGVKNGVTVIDDFAHHPTAVRETIDAVKTSFPDHRLVALFEPRTNSSMRKVFQNDYPSSFDRADLICIRKPPLLKKIPLDDRFSSELLVKDLKKAGKDAYYFSDTDAIVDFVDRSHKKGDIILVMSNGGFDNIHERLLEVL